MTTPDEFDTLAAKKLQEANDSFDRSDTDGFLSQWAGHLSSQANSMKARLAENGNRAEFPAIFDLEGNLVPAKYIRTVYGWTWALLSSEDPTSSFTGFFKPSEAKSDNVRVNNDAKKGYYVGRVLAPAAVGTSGSGYGLSGALSVHNVVYRVDRGFSTDVIILDNGKN